MKNEAEARPALSFSRLSLVCELISLICLLLMAVLLALNWHSLPAQIPSHYAANGQPDQWGGRSAILLMPILSVLMAALLTGCRFLPASAYNFPVSLTDENRDRLMALAREMTSALKAGLLLVFLLLFVPQLQARAASPWLLPLSLFLILAPAVVYLLLMVKNK